MTTIPIHSRQRQESFAEALIQAFEAVRDLAGLADELGEKTTVRTQITVRVFSEAEVDAAAAEMRVPAERPCHGHYRAVKHAESVTITVAYTADPASGPADTAMIAAVRHMAGSDLPGNAA